MNENYRLNLVLFFLEAEQRVKFDRLTEDSLQTDSVLTLWYTVTPLV